MKMKTARSSLEFTTLEDFLKDEGKLKEFGDVAVKEVLAWQIAAAKKRRKERQRCARRNRPRAPL
jgi:hypothetical protein